MLEKVPHVKTGDRVRLIKSCRDIRFPTAFKAGETGQLGKRYRLQDEIEIWELILDSGQRIAIRHVDVEIIG